MRIKQSQLVFVGLALVLVLRLTLSSWTLDNLYPYTSDGGAFYQKLHPGTWVLVLLLGAVVFFRGVSRFVSEQVTGNRGAVILLFLVLAMLSFSALRFGGERASNLVDTFLATAIVALLLVYSTPWQRSMLGAVVFFLVGVNSLIAVAEFVARTTLFPQPLEFGFFRSSGFLGHPLANALVTSVCALAALAMPWSLVARSAYIAVSLLALMAFGARGAMAATLLGIFAYLAIIGFTERRRSRFWVLPLSYSALAASVAVVAVVVFNTEFGASIASRLYLDDSAQTRLSSLNILRQFSPGELLFGVGPEPLIDTAAAEGVSIVENFWVILLAYYGGLLVALLSVSTWLALRSSISRAGWVAWLVFFFFILAASTNNSLSSKSVALIVLLVLLDSLAQARAGRAR